MIMKPTNSRDAKGQPDQEKKKRQKKQCGIWAPFPPPTANSFVVGWAWFYVGNRLQETPNPTKLSANTVFFVTGVHSNQDLAWCVKIGVYMGFWVHRGSWLLCITVSAKITDPLYPHYTPDDNYTSGREVRFLVRVGISLYFQVVTAEGNVYPVPITFVSYNTSIPFSFRSVLHQVYDSMRFTVPWWRGHTVIIKT